MIVKILKNQMIVMKKMRRENKTQTMILNLIAQVVVRKGMMNPSKAKSFGNSQEIKLLHSKEDISGFKKKSCLKKLEMFSMGSPNQHKKRKKQDHKIKMKLHRDKLLDK